MEALVSASLGPMGRLLRQLHSPDWVSQGEIRDLINLLQGISLSLKNLSEAEDPSLTAKCWMKGVRELCYDTEDYLDDSAHNTDDVKDDFKNLKARAEGVIERLKTYKIDLPSYRKILTIGRRLAAVDADLIDYSPIYLKLENSLDIGKEKQLKVVSLIGPGGVGKTTLAKKLYKKHRGNFHCRALLRVSPKPDNMMLLTSLFTQIHQKEPSCNSSVQDLIKNIAEHLRDKRYLILLDDLWSTSIWHIISRALPVGECCSRIVTTTQIEDVALACCSYQSKNVLKMEPLDDVKSGKLFFNRAFGSEDLCPPDLKEVSFGIIRKCGGLPLSTVNITSLLASEPKLQMKQWEHISDSLPSTLMGNPTSEGMKEIVKFVYNNLPPHLKTCLLYLSMYPAGHTVLKDDLVKQWVVEDFAGNEQTARGYFDELVTGGMIEAVDTSDTGEVLSCTVQHLVLDLIVNESMEENFIITWNYFQSTTALRDEVRRLSIQFGGARGANISKSITMPQVIRSFFFFGFSDRVRSSIGDYKFLRVLALHIWAYQDKTFDLSGVRELLRLRYLKIVCNVAVKLPDEIQGQRCLEILEVYATLVAIPSDIGELLKLRILNIAVMNLSSNDICSLQKLPALTALWVHVKTAPTEKIVFDKGGFSVLKYFKFRCPVPWLKFEAGSMTDLRNLDLCFNAHEADQRGTVAISIEHLPGLNEITAHIWGADNFRTAISNHPSNPRIDVQLVDRIFHGDATTSMGTKAKEHMSRDEGKVKDKKKQAADSRMSTLPGSKRTFSRVPMQGAVAAKKPKLEIETDGIEVKAETFIYGPEDMAHRMSKLKIETDSIDDKREALSDGIEDMDVKHPSSPINNRIDMTRQPAGSEDEKRLADIRIYTSPGSSSGVPCSGPRSYEETRERRANNGKGLERISRRRGGKLPLVIPEGRLRPEAPLLAAKFATECNVTVRGHVPVFKHWKDYKDPEGNVREGIYKNFVGKVGNKFEMDVKAVPIRKACTEMLKHAIRQQRYRLKQKYFDPFPLNLVTKTSPVDSMTNDQWNELVESWKDPKKMEISEINKTNRAQVKFHQTTGSRSYPVQCDIVREKYKDKEPTALDLFKECHYSSKKKGFTDVVQAAITEMENKASQPIEDGQQSNSVTKAVAEVLAEHTKKPMFLKHVGIQHVQKRSSRSDREAELVAEKREKAELWMLVETLTNQLKESEEARIRLEESMTMQEEENRKKQAEMESKIEFLLKQMQSRSAQG